MNIDKIQKLSKLQSSKSHKIEVSRKNMLLRSLLTKKILHCFIVALAKQLQKSVNLNKLL